jgi:hypothetical protein
VTSVFPGGPFKLLQDFKIGALRSPEVITLLSGSQAMLVVASVAAICAPHRSRSGVRCMHRRCSFGARHEQNGGK